MTRSKFLLLLILLFPLKVAGQNCPPNIGFEVGNFDYWLCESGLIDKQGVLNLPVQGPVYGRQAMINKPNAGLDYYGGFPVLCPNGSSHSIQLGNDETPSIAQRVSYTFNVPANQADYTLFYNYAVVLQDPSGTNHTEDQKPRFTAKVFDISTNEYLECASFTFKAGTSLPGFKLSPYSNGKGLVYYKDWTPSSINLHNLAGKTVRVEFTAQCCSPGGHFGYAYLDVNEDCSSAIGGNIYCTGEKSLKLYAPAGFYQYYWYNADFTKLLGSDYTLRLTPPPPNNTRIALRIVPYPGLGCPDTIYTTIVAMDAGFNLNIPDSIVVCPDIGKVDLTAIAANSGSTPGMTYSFYTDSDAINYLPSPNVVSKAGVYFIKGTSPAGCSNILPVKVAFHGPTIKVVDPAPVTYPATVDISKTFTHIDSLTYTYYADAKLTNQIDNYTALHFSGTYYIKGVSQFGCATIARVNVVVNPPPPPVIDAPNTFTPNNDAVNDFFMVNIKGYAKFIKLQIYTRSGMLIYTANDLEQVWDGTYNGKLLPVATYYWLFSGMNTYYKTPLSASGSIAIVR